MLVKGASPLDHVVSAGFSRLKQRGRGTFGCVEKSTHGCRLRRFTGSSWYSVATDEYLPMNPRMCLLDSQMWREAFLSVADDIDRLSRDVGDKVADDPLASIGMANPARKGKGKEESLGASSLPTKRRRKEGKGKGAASAAATAATVALDPFARRRTRPKTYWAVGNEVDSEEVFIEEPCARLDILLRLQ